jgi:hypothetical protein
LHCILSIVHSQLTCNKTRCSIQIHTLHSRQDVFRCVLTTSYRRGKTAPFKDVNVTNHASIVRQHEQRAACTQSYRSSSTTPLQNLSGDTLVHLKQEISFFTHIHNFFRYNAVLRCCRCVSARKRVKSHSFPSLFDDVIKSRFTGIVHGDFVQLCFIVSRTAFQGAVYNASVLYGSNIKLHRPIPLRIVRVPAPVAQTVGKAQLLLRAQRKSTYVRAVYECNLFSECFCVYIFVRQLLFAVHPCGCRCLVCLSYGPTSDTTIE